MSTFQVEVIEDNRWYMQFVNGDELYQGTCNTSKEYLQFIKLTGVVSINWPNLTGYFCN